ncbi:asparaginase [Halonatronum saccharophilum]|uniref:asparaginase n=1 Tax=Halonatronum saccharophilum TaxID=150060 RepID=UPI0004863572|nr:asparaginase [Halonatronum saccharophilum]
MKKIKIITTGGTIAMGQDNKSNQIVPKLSGSDLLDYVPELKNIAQLDLLQYSNLDSSQLSPNMILGLAKKVEEALADESISGVLITHGTDTVEETAYLLDLILDVQKPVVITGALRSFNQLSSDGEANLVHSLQTILDPRSKNKGVLIAINNQIHAARFIYKVHTNKLTSFASLNAGPIGYIDHCGVHYFYDLAPQITVKTDKLKNRVDIIKLSIGTDDTLIQAALDSGTEGIVLEAFGVGTIPKRVTKGLFRAKEEGIPVVLTSRCLEGRVYNLYGASAGGVDISELDLIFARTLNSTKARLLLMLLLSRGLSKGEIRKYFALKLKM